VKNLSHLLFGLFLIKLEGELSYFFPPLSFVGSGIPSRIRYPFPDPGIRDKHPESGIRDKHPESAILKLMVATVASPYLSYIYLSPWLFLALLPISFFKIKFSGP
jgi:hypothetical protein